MYFVFQERLVQNLCKSWWAEHVQGGLTLQVLAQIDTICDLIEDVTLTDEPDTFRWGLSESGAYSSASAYGAMFFGCSFHEAAKHIWKIQVPAKVRFFLWLVMHQRCWTADRRWRRGLQDSNLCIFCDQEPESIEHLLLSCVYTREVWQLCLVRLHLLGVVTMFGSSPLHCWVTQRKNLHKPVRQAFDSFFALVCWSVWKERNNRTFNGVSSSPTVLTATIFQEAQAWAEAGYKKLLVLLQPV